jgi:hypothetical protein
MGGGTRPGARRLGSILGVDTRGGYTGSTGATPAVAAGMPIEGIWGRVGTG